MRLFVAGYPPEQATASLSELLARVWPELGAPWRQVPAQRWHLTLAFLGEVAPERVDELSGRLARAALRADPVRVRLAGGGAFPTVRAARVLWVGIDGELVSLRRLADRVVAAARRSGIPVAGGGFRPHLTVARHRGGGADALGWQRALDGYAGPPWPLGPVHLVRSQLGPRPWHETLRTFPLGRAD